MSDLPTEIFHGDATPPALTHTPPSLVTPIKLGHDYTACHAQIGTSCR